MSTTFCRAYCLFVLQAYSETERVQWVKQWPGQVVLCTSQIYWTLEVHEAIRAGAGVSATHWLYDCISVLGLHDSLLLKCEFRFEN